MHCKLTQVFYSCSEIDRRLWVYDTDNKGDGQEKETEVQAAWRPWLCTALCHLKICSSILSFISVLPYSAEASEGLAGCGFCAHGIWWSALSGLYVNYCYVNLYLKRETIYSNYGGSQLNILYVCSQKALISYIFPVLRLPVMEFGLGDECCHSDLKAEIQAAEMFRHISGHSGDPSPWDNGHICPFRVWGLLFWTVCSLYLLYLPHLMGKP